MDFIFRAAGHKKPRVHAVDFGQTFDPTALKTRFGSDDHTAIESAHDHRQGTVYVNTKAKNASGQPPSFADRAAALQHENVHYQISKLAHKHHDPDAARLGIAGHFIKLIGHPMAYKLGQYIDKTRKSAGHKELSDEALAHEIIPHLASISTPGSSHRQSFMKLHGLTEETMKPYDSAWQKACKHADSWGANAPAGEAPVKPLDAKVAEVKSKYAEPAAPTTDQQVEQIKNKYKKFLKSEPTSWSVAAGLQPSTEQWEATLANQLGIPADRETAEAMAKAAEERWERSIADSFNSLAQPVEKTQTTDWGRGPVDQNDESQLTEEEQRIRAIKVDPRAAE